MSTESTESNRSSRFMAGIPARLQSEHGDVSCRAHNLSRSGVLLTGDIPTPDTSEARLTLSSHGGDLNVSLTGRITRTERDPESGQLDLAVEFLAISDDEVDALEALLSRVIEGGQPGALAALPDNAPRDAVRAALESVPLAHRISLASRAVPREREFLMQDTHVQVIDALARNPSLLAHEVMRIVRMHNLLPHTLQVIGTDSRWAGNENVMVLVVSHRNTPMGVADQIVSRMGPQTLQHVIQAPDLHPAVRTKVLRRLKKG